MLRFRVAYHYRDYNGETGESGFTVVNVSNVQALDSFVLQYESVMQAMSDAPIWGALAYAKMPPYVQKPVTGPAKVTQRLLCLYTDGSRYGSFLVPAARELVVDAGGPFATWRLVKDEPNQAAAIVALGAELGGTLLADGTPFPLATDWRAAYTNYRG